MTGWLNDATCRSHLEAGGDDLWFEPGRQHEAVAACLRCPVLPDCQQHVLASPQITDGVWGGLTGPQLERVRRGERVSAPVGRRPVSSSPEATVRPRARDVETAQDTHSTQVRPTTEKWRTKVPSSPGTTVRRAVA